MSRSAGEISRSLIPRTRAAWAGPSTSQSLPTPSARCWPSSAYPPGTSSTNGPRMVDVAFGRTRNRSLLGTMNDFGFMARTVDAKRGRARIVGGPDAIPRTGADPAAERRKTDRPHTDALQELTLPSNAVGWSLPSPIIRARLGAARLPSRRSALRGLDAPKRALEIGYYRSDAHVTDRLHAVVVSTRLDELVRPADSPGAQLRGHRRGLRDYTDATR